MSISALIRRMSEAGAPYEAIAIAVEEIEAIQASLEAYKIVDRERSARRRALLPGNWESLRLTVFQRDDWTCRYCGVRSQEMHCDHVMPLSRGGGNSLSNLVAACGPCNISKGAKTPEEWRQ